ncbi:MAG: hypothetical protein WCB02_05195, partial [Bradyrhizobium sp.]
MGAEVAIAPNWTARLEYLHDHLGSVTVTFPSGTGYGSAFDLNMIRLWLNYKVNWTDTTAAATKTTVTGIWPIAPDNWNVHGQFSFIEQGYPAFFSPY